MARDIEFKSVPVEVAELLREQVDSAMQIIAALVLTDEEVAAYTLKRDPQARPENVGGWATSMREELLSPEWRGQLKKVLLRQGFLTNTHPGFPLGALEDNVPQVYMLGRAFDDLERMLQEYADGKGEDQPEHESTAQMSDARRRASMEKYEKDVKAFWAARLVAAGHHKVVASWCVKRIGYMLALQASMERLMRPVRAKQEAGGSGTATSPVSAGEPES